MIVVGAGASSRMGGTDKLAARSGAGRCSPGRSTRWRHRRPSRGPSSSPRPTGATRWPRLAWLPAGVIEVVAGGARRQESVRAGFAAFDRHAPDPTGVVLVHDAARPLVDAALVTAVAEATARHGAAIPVVPVAETLKRIDGDRVGETVDRAGLGAAQTPQGARRDLLREAWAPLPGRWPGDVHR